MSTIQWDQPLEIIGSDGTPHPAATSVLCRERFVWQADMDDPALLLWDETKQRVAYFCSPPRPQFSYAVRNVPAVASAIPWTFESMPLAVKVRRKCDRSLLLAHPSCETYVFTSAVYPTYAELLRDYEQLDGSPCGIVPASPLPR